MPIADGIWVMRRYLFWAAALASVLLSSQPLQAGLYNTDEPYRGPRLGDNGATALGFSQFRDLLTTNLGIAVTLQESPTRKHYLEKSAELERKARAGGLSTQEKVNLSEYLIRLGKVEEAVQLLTPVASQERSNFMVFANLATAHQLVGRLERAGLYLEQVKLLWPHEWPGFKKEELDWYKEVEKYHLKLVRLRYRETLSAGKAKGSETLDALFGDDNGPLQFVGDNGHFQAGKLAAKEQKKLPKEAVPIVQQLLLWIPGAAPGMEDTRLYWLLGELYNAQGFTSNAAYIYDRCVWSHRFPATELREHQKIVKAALPEPEAIAKTPTRNQSPVPATSLPETRPLDLRQVAIMGSVAGAVVLGLLYLQLRELKRRHKTS